MPQNKPKHSDIDKLVAEYSDQRLDQEADRQGVPRDFVRKIAGAESSGRPDIINGMTRSRTGAIGKMQLMPGTAKDLGVDPEDIDGNIRGGVSYAGKMLKEFGGDLTKAAAAYNAGPGAVRKYGGVPPYAETQAYVQKVATPAAPESDIDKLVKEFQQGQQAPAPDAAPIVPAKPFTRPAKPGPIRNLQRGPIVTPMQRQAQDAAANPFATNQGATGFQQQAQQAYERTQGLGQGRPQGWMAAANQFKQSALKGLARIPQGISEDLQMPVGDAERRLAQTMGPAAMEDIKRREGGQLRAITAATEPVVKKIEQAYPVDQADQSWTTAKIPAAAGSLVPMLVAAALGRGVGARSAATSGISGAIQSGAEVSDRLNKAGVQGPHRDRSAAMAIATGATEALGLGRALDKIGAKRAILGRIGNVAEDVAQEYGQEYLGDINAKLVGQYDRNASLSPISPNKLEAAALGGILGGAMQGAGAAVSQRPGAPLATPPIQPEPQQPMTRVDPLSVDARGRITGGRSPIQGTPQQTHVTKIPTGADYARLTAEPTAPKADAAQPVTDAPQAAPALAQDRLAGIRVIAEGERVPASQRRNIKAIVVKDANGVPQTIRAILPEGMTPAQARGVIRDAQKAQEPAAPQAQQATTEPLAATAQVNPKQAARNDSIQKAYEDSLTTRTEADAAMREGRHDDAIKAYKAEADALRALRDQIPNKSRGGRIRRTEAGNRLREIDQSVKAVKLAQRQAAKGQPVTPQVPRPAIENAPTRDLTAPMVPDAPQTARMQMPGAPKVAHPKTEPLAAASLNRERIQYRTQDGPQSIELDTDLAAMWKEADGRVEGARGRGGNATNVSFERRKTRAEIAEIQADRDARRNVDLAKKAEIDSRGDRIVRLNDDLAKEWAEAKRRNQQGLEKQLRLLEEGGGNKKQEARIRGAYNKKWVETRDSIERRQADRDAQSGWKESPVAPGKERVRYIEGKEQRAREVDLDKDLAAKWRAQEESAKGNRSLAKGYDRLGQRKAILDEQARRDRAGEITDEPTNRLRAADYPGGEMPRTAGLRPEGQPVEIPAERMQENTNRLPGAEYAGGEVRRGATGPMEGQPVGMAEDARVKDGEAFAEQAPPQGPRPYEVSKEMQRRRDERGIAFKGPFGKFAEQSRKFAKRDHALASHPELRQLLDLPEMPDYKTQGKQWTEATNDTMNALAELADQPRSSYIDDDTIQGAWARIEKRAKERGTPISNDLRETMAETWERHITAQSNYQNLMVDGRTDNILRRLDQAGGNLSEQEAKRLEKAFISLATSDDYKLSNNLAKNLWKVTVSDAQARSVRRGTRAATSPAGESGAPSRAADVRAERRAEPVRATGTDGRGRSVEAKLPLERMKEVVAPVEGPRGEPIEPKAPGDFQRFRDANAKVIASLNSITPAEAGTSAGKARFNAAVTRLRKNAELEPKSPPPEPWQLPQAESGLTKREHKAQVERQVALGNGDAIPDRVLQQYPDLYDAVIGNAPMPKAPDAPPAAPAAIGAASASLTARGAAGDAGKAAPKAKRAAKAKPAPPAAPEPAAAKPAGRIDGKDVTADEMAVYDALAKVQPRFTDDAAASLTQARAEAGLSKEAFDRAALSLADKEILALHGHDFPQSLSPEGRAALVQGKSAEYIAAALRTPGAKVERAGATAEVVRPTQAEQRTVSKAAKEEKVSPRTGLTKTQEGYLVDKLKESLPELKTDQSRPVTIKIPGDGEFTVKDPIQANNLAYRVIGKPLEAGWKPTVKRATGQGTPEAKPSKKFDPDGYLQIADDAMRVYGHPEKALAELKRQYDEQTDADPEQYSQSEHSSIATAIQELEARVQGKTIKGQQTGRQLGQPVYDYSYNVAEEMARLGAPAPTEVPAKPARKPRVKGFVGKLDRDESGGRREVRIEEIVNLAQKPIPEIREIRVLKGTDGNWYRATGFPQGVRHTGETKVDGYAFTDKQGVTFGQGAKTREELIARYEDSTRRNAEDLRESLKDKTDAELEEALNFWKERRGRQDRLAAPIPPPATKAAPVKKKAARSASAKAETAKTTGSEENDARLAKLRERARPGRGLSGMDENLLRLYEAQEKADPKKWRVGDGVGWKVLSGGRHSQTNRGFRIVQIDPETKLALIRSVADTGLTRTGGDYDKIGDEWVHIADLVRDGKYNDPNRKSTTLGSGFGALQGMGKLFQRDTAPPKDADLTGWVNKMGRSIHESMDDASLDTFDRIVNQAADAAEAGDKAAWNKYRRQAEAMIQAQPERDSGKLDTLRSPLSNLNFKGTYERLAGETGKEISEMIRKAQIEIDRGGDRNEIIRALRRDAREYEKALRYNNLPNLAQMLKDHVDHISRPDGVWDDVARKARSAQYNLKLRFNPRSTAVNLLQPFQTLWPHMSTADFARVSRQAASAEAKKRIDDIFGEETGLSTQEAKAGRKWDLFGKASAYNRRVGYLAGEMMADRLGMTGEAKDRLARDWAKKVEFDTSKYDAPPLFQGNAAAVLLQFKAFQAKNIERIIADAKAAPEGSITGKKARLAKMVFSQMAIGGLNSIPGSATLGGLVLMGAMAHAIKGMGASDEVSEKAAEAFYYGLPALVGLDFSGSVGILDAPFGKTMAEKAVNYLGGPTGSTIVKLLEEGKTFFEAEDSARGKSAEEKREGAMLRTAKAITPYTKTAIAGYAAAAGALGKRKGMTPDLPIGGKPVPMTPTEAVGFGLMGTPVRQSKFYDEKDMPDWQKKLRSKITGKAEKGTARRPALPPPLARKPKGFGDL